MQWTSTVAPNLDQVSADIASTGCAVIPNVLSPPEVQRTVKRLWKASAESQRRGVPAHTKDLDPNPSNVRVFNLVDLDSLFAALLEHPVADAIASRFLGEGYIVSNFTANIAQPGSRSMFVHSDQSLVAPSPWAERWALNLMWCLTDVHRDNGATLHVPGSHRWQTPDDVPAALDRLLIPLEAPAGSVIAMDGRVWHTSGANITADQDRPVLFAYYTRPFLRPQWNFSAALRPEIQAELPSTLRRRLGLGIGLNVGGHG